MRKLNDILTFITVILFDVALLVFLIATEQGIVTVKGITAGTVLFILLIVLGLLVKEASHEN